MFKHSGRQAYNTETLLIANVAGTLDRWSHLHSVALQIQIEKTNQNTLGVIQ